MPRVLITLFLIQLNLCGCIFNRETSTNLKTEPSPMGRTPNALYDFPEYDLTGEQWFQTISNLADESPSIDQFLSRLPNEIKSEHILMFESKSLQEASYQLPRVILFSPKGHFVMTFNGDPSQRGFEALETMRFVRSQNKPRFIFQEIVFPDDLKARKDFLQKSRKIKELDELSDRSLRFGPNPPLCLTCHRSDPRPNWEHYAFWPGAYGQFDDRPFVTTANESEIHPHNGDIVDASKLNITAARELPLFLKAAVNAKRYRHLANLKIHSELQRNSYKRTKAQILSKFTETMAHLNFERIMRILAESNDPVRNARRFLWATQHCKSDADSEHGYRTWYTLQQVYSKTDIPWEDFFMNLYPNKINDFATPLNARRTILAFIWRSFPDLRKYIETPINAGTLGFRSSRTKDFSCEVMIQ